MVHRTSDWISKLDTKDSPITADIYIYALYQLTFFDAFILFSTLNKKISLYITLLLR